MSCLIHSERIRKHRKESDVRFDDDRGNPDIDERERFMTSSMTFLMQRVLGPTAGGPPVSDASNSTATSDRDRLGYHEWKFWDVRKRTMNYRLQEIVPVRWAALRWANPLSKPTAHTNRPKIHAIYRGRSQSRWRVCAVQFVNERVTKWNVNPAW